MIFGFRDCPSGFSDVPGEIVEQGSKTNFINPVHNYTKALIASRPSLISV
jgi:ABC-type oligopeptide transport system ATPase subunit